MCLFFDQSILERVKLCKILNPFIFLIMFIDHRQFNDLVQIEYKVDNHNRQFQDKCADASQRNNDTPQSYRITQHSKLESPPAAKIPPIVIQFTDFPAI